MADSKTPSQGSSQAAPATWRFAGAYPCIYCNYQHVSGWVNPGDPVDWPDGPPDGNWERVDPPPPETPAQTAPPASAPPPEKSEE